MIKLLLNKKLTAISSILVFLFSASLLVSGKSYSYIAITLCFLSLCVLPITLKNKLHPDFYKISWALSGYFFVTALSLYCYGGKISNLDMPSRTLLTLPVLIFLLSYPPKKEWLFRGIIAGSIISGLISLYHHKILNIRSFSDFGYMVIQSGNMAMSLGVFSLIIAFQYKKEKNTLLASIALVASCFAILASLLSGARGSWIIAPFILLWLLIVNRHLISTKIVLATPIFLIAITLLSFKAVEKRVGEVIHEIDQYTETDNTTTSSGIRIELWKSGLYAFAEKPIFGIGYQKRKDFKAKLVEQDLVDPIVLSTSRLHNSYIEELSIKGVIGFTALMLFFLVPLYFFIKPSAIKNNVFCQLGVAHITLVMGYCLTQNYINHHSGIIQYLMFVIIFYAMLKNEEHNKLSFRVEVKK